MNWKDTTEQNYIALNMLTGGGSGDGGLSVSRNVTVLSLPATYLQSSVGFSVVEATSPSL